MKPINIGGHAAYQKRVLDQLRKYYPDAASSLPTSTWEIMEKFWTLDLSEVDSIMSDRYSDFGPAPRLPSDMLRYILLSVEFKSLLIPGGPPTLRKTFSIPSFPAFPSAIPSAPVRFTISCPASGFPMMTTSRPKSVPQRKTTQAKDKGGEGAACRKGYG